MAHVANGRKINSLFGNILIKIISSALKNCRPKKCYVSDGENLSFCKMTISGLVIQIFLSSTTFQKSEIQITSN
jgi:hypothetical protein